MRPSRADAQRQPAHAGHSAAGRRGVRADGYIRVFQDVRGKYGSEGDYMMTRPLRGPLNSTATDESTDAYDTIDWLVKNIPESNGRVGMIGSSYEGFTVVMALVDPHPALKVAAPRARWWTAGWAMTGSTTVPFARQSRLLRRADHGARRRDSVIRAKRYDDYEFPARGFGR